MTVRPGDPESADAEVVQRHVKAVGKTWRDPVRRRRLFERAVRLRGEHPGLPDFPVIPDARVAALGGGVVRLVPAPGGPRRSVVGRSADLRRDQVPAEVSYVTAMAVVI